MEALALVMDRVMPLAEPWLLGVAFMCVMTAIELVRPHEAQSIPGRLPGLLFWLLGIPVALAAHALYRALWERIGLAPVDPFAWMPDMGGWAVVAGALAAPVVGAAIYDFFFYWFHRAQHRWFWRFHAVHHSIRELNAVNAYHHVSEPLFQMLFLLLPASLIAVEGAHVVPLMGLMLQAQASFIHSAARVEIGPLRAAIVDNRFHRIHHSLEERHFDRNFGAFTTLWDRMFGTAWVPAQDEWPATGLAEIAPPRSVCEWIDLPARIAHSGAAPTGTAETGAATVI
jgi:sterol desaturase/sphingolipid hydroxylase (fatty acid hydroxylase superfamily)